MIKHVNRIKLIRSPFKIFQVLLSMNSCTTDTDTTTIARTILDSSTLFPSPDVLIPYHTKYTKNYYIKQIVEFKVYPLQFGNIVFIGNSIIEQGFDWKQRFKKSYSKNRGIKRYLCWSNNYF